MKKRHLLKTMLLLFALIMGSSSVWADDVTDVLNQGLTGVTGTSYTEWTGKTSNSDAVYAGQSAGGNSSIQLRSSNNNSGIVTTASGGKVKKITVTWNSNTQSGRTLNVYGKNSAYSVAADLYDTSKQGTLLGTIVYGTSTELTVTGDYEYIGFRSASGAMYLTSVSIVWETSSGSQTAAATSVTIDALGITNTDVYTGTAAGSLSATVKAGDTSIDGATVTWTSSDENVAKIDASTGVVTLVAAGTVTFTASYAGVSGTYQASSATYELTVTDSTPYVQPTEIEIIPNYTFWGKTAQFSGSDYSKLSGSKDNVSLSWTRGDGSTYANQNAMRFYKDNTLTFTAPSGYEIKKIVLEVAGTYNDLSFNPQGFSSETKTWTGSSETVSMSRPSNASSYATISKFTITIGLPSTDPSITAYNVDIAYDATGGNIAFTVNNEVEGGSISASTIDTWVSLGNQTTSPISFTCDANTVATERTATVTLTYTYNTNETVTKEVTITQAGNPNVVDNISDITEVGSSYKVRGTVVATNSRGFVIGDGTGYVYTYLNAAPTQSIGNKVTISGTTGSYGHIIQFTNTATVSEATSSNYTAGMPAAIVLTAVPDYTQGYHLSTYLEFEGTLSKDGNNYLITLGESQIQISYPSNDQETALTALDGKTVCVKGYFSGINSNSKFTIMLESVEEVVSTEPSISLSNYNVEAPVEGKEGTITVTYNNITDVEAEVKFYEADGTTETTYDWVTAEINSDNNVDYLIDANNGPARTAYMKVYALDDDAQDVYSELITITQAKYVIEYATLPFEFNGGSAKIQDTDGLTANGLGTDYNSNNSKLKFDNTDDYLVLKINEAPGVLTFDIKGNGFSGGKFTVQSSADGTNYADLVSYTDLSGTEETKLISGIGSDVRYFKWIYTEKVDGNVGLGNIKLDKILEKETVTVSDAKYATYSSAYSLDFSGSGIRVYTAKANGTSVKLTEVSDGIVPANTGVVLYSAEAVTKDVPVTTATGTADWSNNEMVANVVRAKVYLTEGDKTNYILSNEDAGVGFYKAAANGAYLPANRAYLSTTETATGNAPFLGFDGNETTGINSVERGALSVEGCYTLDGRRVTQPTKGLYIVNGRKVIIK